MGKIKVYITTVSANVEIKKQQKRIEDVLHGKKLNPEYIDVSSDDLLREEMRLRTGDPSAMPPQIFNDDDYCGDFDMFEDAIEMETLEEFLKLGSSPDSQQQSNTDAQPKCPRV